LFKKPWLATLLVFAMVFSLIGGASAEAKGKKNHKGHGKQPLKQWEAVGYAAHIAGWGFEESDDDDDDHDDEDIDESLNYKELITLANKHLRKMKEESWFDETGYTTNKPASAAWTMHLWINALAERKGWTIDWEKVDEAALAEKLGLTDWHPNGKYVPDKPIKKGEVGDILEGLSELDSDDIELLEVTAYTGIITEIFAQSKTFKANIQNGNQAVVWSVTVNDAVQIVYNGQIVPFSTLLVGDGIRLIMDENRLKKIVITSHQVNKVELVGDITAITDGTNGKALSIVRMVNGVAVSESYVVPSIAKIFAGGTIIGFSDLLVGDDIKLTLENNVLTRIDVLNVINMVREGEITSLAKTGTTTTFQIRDANQVNHVYTMNNEQEVIYSDWKLRVTDLLSGDKIKITTQRNQLVTVEITDRATAIQQGVLQTVTYPTTNQPLGIITLRVGNEWVQLYWSAETTLVTQNKPLNELVQKTLVIVAEGNVVTSIIYNP
jgi:hypothetical protein